MTVVSIEKFVKSRPICFVASVDEDSFPNIKAVLKPRKMQGIKEFYFSSNTSSLRAKQFLKNPKASLYFYRKGLFRYTGVMLIGKMDVLTDEVIKKALWRKHDVVFYQKGVDDPDYCILRFTSEKGRYYRDLHTEDFAIETDKT